jgi:hypothetical protein
MFFILTTTSLKASCIPIYNQKIYDIEHWSTTQDGYREIIAVGGLILTAGVATLGVGIEIGIEKLIRKTIARKYAKARKLIIEARNGGGKLIYKLAKSAYNRPKKVAQLIKAADDQLAFCSHLEIIYDYTDIKNAIKYGNLKSYLGPKEEF